MTLPFAMFPPELRRALTYGPLRQVPTRAVTCPHRRAARGLATLLAGSVSCLMIADWNGAPGP
jgi:hypothetical protein